MTLFKLTKYAVRTFFLSVHLHQLLLTHFSTYLKRKQRGSITLKYKYLSPLETKLFTLRRHLLNLISQSQWEATFKWRFHSPYFLRNGWILALQCLSCVLQHLSVFQYFPKSWYDFAVDPLPHHFVPWRISMFGFGSPCWPSEFSMAMKTNANSNKSTFADIFHSLEKTLYTNTSSMCVWTIVP